MTQDEIQTFCQELNHSGISMVPNCPGDEGGRTSLRINSLFPRYFWLKPRIFLKPSLGIA